MTVPELGRHQRVHLVGIAGAGMSPLARILLARGHPVSGTDLRGGRAAVALTAMGATIGIGHAAEAVDGADLVVVSTAVPDDNAEVARARELGLPIVRRAELLAALMRDRLAMLIAGTHGKTTTTSMVAVALQAASMDPSFAIGGMLHGASTSAHHGSGGVFVAEADESDRSFLVFDPDCVVVTNIELDHTDTFRDLDDVIETFLTFLDLRHPAAPAIVCLDDPVIEQLVAGSVPGGNSDGETAAAMTATGRRLQEPVITYGEHPDADVRIMDLKLETTGAHFSLIHFGTDLGPYSIQLPGRHNVANATAAIAASLWAGAAPGAVREGLSRFAGAQRRFQVLGTVAGVTVVDDYGHHPTELSATLSAARQAHPQGRVVALFQPHRYSRTQALAPQLGRALAAADVVVVTDVFGAGETPVVGVTGEAVASAVDGGADVHYRPVLRDAIATVVELAQPGDVVLTLGAGDVTEAGRVLLSALEEQT